MAGMSEYRSKGHESFWTWQDLMYRFLDQLHPHDVMAIVAMTFMEMQKAGYGSVANSTMYIVSLGEKLMMTQPNCQSASWRQRQKLE